MLLMKFFYFHHNLEDHDQILEIRKLNLQSLLAGEIFILREESLKIMRRNGWFFGIAENGC